MPSATAGGANLSAYFKTDGSRTITGPTRIYNDVSTLASDVLTVRGAAGQTGDLLVMQDSAGTDLTRWIADGRQVGTLTVAGSNSEERYAINRSITVTGTIAQVTGGGFIQTNLASGQAALVHTGYAANVVNAGRIDFGQAMTASYLSSSASAQTRGVGFNVVAQHTGAGVMTALNGLLVSTTSSGPATTHRGGYIAATVSGSTSTLIGLDVEVNGSATTKYAARYNYDTYTIGNPRLTGYFQRLDTNEYQLSFGRNSTYGTAQIRIIDAGTANRGFIIASVSSTVMGLFTEGGTLAQINTAGVNSNLLAATGSAALSILGGSASGITFSDYAALSVTYLTMLNKVHTYADGSSMAFGTTNGMKIGTATTQKIGFYNATPIVRPVLATGAGATVDNVITALQNLGLVGQT